jgi:hypothetical protein
MLRCSCDPGISGRLPSIGPGARAEMMQSMTSTSFMLIYGFPDAHDRVPGPAHGPAHRGRADIPSRANRDLDEGGLSAALSRSLRKHPGVGLEPMLNV